MTQFRPGSFQILPTVVKNLIIINAIVAFAQFVLGNMGVDLVDFFGLHYWKSEYFGVWQFVTHMFLHGSIGHIFSNMFALWMFGSILENIWGPKRFLTFYLICGLGAALLHMGVIAYEYISIENAFLAYQQSPSTETLNILEQTFNSMTSMSANFSGASMKEINALLNGFYNANGQYVSGIFDGATIGASGAVFGILFAFGYLFPNTLLYIYFLVPIKAKYVVAAYALFELISGISNSAGDNVAHFAHLGGMLVAFILLRVWKQSNKNHFY